MYVQTGALRDWAKLPAWLSAALREVSLVVAPPKEREFFEPDPYATESPFLTDSWPR